MQPLRLATMLAALTLLGTACAGTTDTSADGATPTPSPTATAAETAATNGQVEIVDFKFQPPTLEVAAGTTVTWTNQDIFGHTVTSGTGPDTRTDDFHGVLGEQSENMGKGLTFSHTFDTPGTYAYYCVYHPNMQAEIVVS